jgi:hypothetical protein
MRAYTFSLAQNVSSARLRAGGRPVHAIRANLRAVRRALLGPQAGPLLLSALSASQLAREGPQGGWRTDVRSAQSSGRLLARLFRACAAELRRRGLDPIELLMSVPDDPASDADTAPGGIRGAAPTRRKWLYPPEVELEKLDEVIAKRLERGHSVAWHEERREQLAEYLVVRAANEPSAEDAS